MRQIERRDAGERVVLARGRIAITGYTHVVAVHVGAQRVRADAGFDRSARHLEAEMRAVADIDRHAAFQRRPHHGMDLAGCRLETKPPG